MEYRPGITKDRRKGPDKITRIIRYMGLAAWGVMLTALALIEKARPEVEGYLGENYNVKLHTDWNLELIRYMFYLMILGFCLSIVGISVNSMRLKRRTDEYQLSILVLALISIVTICYYLFFI